MNRVRPLNVLVAITDPAAFRFGASIVAQLWRANTLNLRIVSCLALDHDPTVALPPEVAHHWLMYDHTGKVPVDPTAPCDNALAADYCAWTDLLILAPIDADDIACMLQGLTGNLHLTILRSWNVSKRIMLVPAMTALMWENPMTKKHISKIRKKWNFVRVLPPLLCNYRDGVRKERPWQGSKEFREAMQTQVDLRLVGERPPPSAHMPKLPLVRGRTQLPPELWTIILETTGDWELATALNVHVSLPVPEYWRTAASKEGPRSSMQRVEWAILTDSYHGIGAVLDAEKPSRLSRRCIELIMRFAMVPVLVHLERHHKDLFWGTFGHTFLPHKASIYGRVEILEYWRTSPTFLTREYSNEAMDNASRCGSLQALDWWYGSGLPLKYSEASLEAASAQGYIQVLQWWKDHSKHRDAPKEPSPDDPTADDVPTRGDLKLKVGKSITYATQSGCLPVLEYWVTSGIPFSHEDTIAKLASTHGHTHLLDYWRGVRGEKMLFDNQVLVGPSKMGHARVLDWWKNSGLRVEYKTCDIEEALEDGVEGVAGDAVRRWWAANGLNLGVGTSEWMKVKVLGQ